MKQFQNCILPKLTNFNDIYEVSKNLNNKQKGDMFEVITYFIFKLHPNYKNITKNIYLFCDIPSQLFETLNIPEKDKGIDLVWETIDSEFYAIQCKFRTNLETIIPWKDLSTFVGLTHGVGKFNKGIYVTNTYGLNEEIINSEKTMSIYGDFFTTLPENFFDLIKASLNNTKLVYKAFTPRNYQIEIINKCEEYYKGNDRGYIVSACGTGKSLSSYWIDSKLKTKLSLVLVPSLHLLSQFYSDWVKQSISDDRTDIYYLLIGSESDFGDSEVTINGKNYNIKDQNGLITTTDLKYIKEKLKKYSKKKIVIISTYQSSDLLLNLSLKIDLCIFDEAHKTVGQKDNKFSLLLEDNSIEIKKRLFMTATPKIYQGIEENENILSMNDEDYYGKEIYNYTIRDAIESGYLSDYQIITMHTDDDYISKFIADNKLVNGGISKTDSYTLMCAIMVYKSFVELKCHHLLTYHSNIKNSIEFSKLLTKLFTYLKIDILVQHMDGKMNMRKRKGIERTFINSEKAIICSAKVLREGVNIPIIDSEMFVDNKSSKIEIIQSVGRALRLHPNKKIARILVPYKCNNIDDIGNDSSVYSNIISIIKSLYDNDTKVVDYFITRDKGKTGGKINNIIRHVNYVGNEEIFTDVKIEEWAKKLDLIIFNKTDSFEYMYSKVKEWIDKNEKIPTHHSKNDEEKRLGKWCSHQRGNNKNHLLSQERINKLNILQNWYWERNLDDIWNNNYENIKSFIEQNKKFPSEYSKDKIEKKYAIWIGNQKRKKENKLTQDQIVKLNLINIKWSSKNKKKLVTWEERYKEINKFIDKNNRFPSAESKDKIEKSIGLWCSSQRTRKNKLTQDKKDKLELLQGWCWSILDNQWTTKYDEIKRLIDIDGRILLKYKWQYKWCQLQKELYNKDKLSQDRIDKLLLLKNWKF